VNAEDAARRLVERVRTRRWGLATVAISGDATSFALDAGDDPIDEASLFQIGSITKTMTGVLLADVIVRGDTSADATLRDVLGIDGAAGDITLGQLATQRSGLPRLPENLAVQQDPRDPYANYTPEDLRDALRTVELGTPEYLYSNFGLMTLGLALSTISGTPLPTLWVERLFAPLGMTRAGCPGPTEGRLPGYSGSEITPWWTTRTPGAGGIGASIRDMGAYLRGHVDPPAGTIGQAIELATTVHAAPPSPLGYGWGYQGGGWWHNGATYGFQSFAAFHRPTRTAVALLANTGEGAGLDAIGFRTLTEMVRRAGV
jgi:CubicO group peptidase (beta-lactamase class C family)